MAVKGKNQPRPGWARGQFLNQNESTGYRGLRHSLQ